MGQSLTATLRLQLIDDVSRRSQAVADALKGVDKTARTVGKGSTPEIQRLSRSLDELKRRSDALKNLSDSMNRMSAARQVFVEQKRNLEALARAYNSSSAPTRKMAADLNTARAAVKSASAAFREEAEAAKAARRGLDLLGGAPAGRIVQTQRQLREEMRKTGEELRRQTVASRTSVPSVGNRGGHISAGVAGGVLARGGAAMWATAGGGYLGLRGVRNVYANGIDFSRERDAQRAVSGFSHEQQAPLLEQAYRVGFETPYTTADIVRGQTSLIQAGIRDPQTIIAMVDEIKNYAMAMGVTMEEATETIRGSLQSTNKDLSTAVAATKSAKDWANFAVNLAKLTGMSDDDVRLFYKYAGSAGAVAGFSDPTIGAAGGAMRLGGLRGDEAGVAMRTASAKLVSPTNKGAAALAALGIDYNKYTKMDGIGLGAFETYFKQKFGKGFTPKIRAQLEDMLENGTYTDAVTGDEMPIFGDRSRFTEASSEILSALFAKNKKGQMAAADRKALAKSVDDFHKLSVDSVDVDGLFRAIIEAEPSLAQLNAIFTERQGARLGQLVLRKDKFFELLEALIKTDPGHAERIASERMKGLYGAHERFKGSIENLATKIAVAWEPQLIGLLDGAAGLADKLGNAGDGVLRLGSAAAAAAVALAALRTASLVKGAIGGTAGATVGGAAGGAVAGGAAGEAAAGGSTLLALARASGPGLLGLAAYWGAMAALATAFPADPVRGRPGQYGQPMYPPRTKGGQSDVRSMPGIQGEGSGVPIPTPRPNYGSIPIPTPRPDYQALKEEANATGSAIQQALSVTATPTVNTSAMDIALTRARIVGAAIKAALSGGGGGRLPPLHYTGDSGDGSARIGGARAAGGPVRGDRAYIIGENGPEVWKPPGAGNIVPTGQLAGGIKATFNITSADPMATAREIERVLNRLLTRSSQLAIDDRGVV